MNIRIATENDVAGITEIYNRAVRTSTAVWNEIEVDIANRRRWMEDKFAAGYPVLVAADNDVVLGYATYGPFRPFDGYRHTVENSIYVHEAAQGRGIGSALLNALVFEAEGNNIHVMVAAIEAENTASIALHAKHGFTQVGRMPEVGTKFGTWLDLLLMQRMLNQDNPDDSV